MQFLLRYKVGTKEREVSALTSVDADSVSLQSETNEYVFRKHKGSITRPDVITVFRAPAENVLSIERIAEDDDAGD